MAIKTFKVGKIMIGASELADVQSATLTINADVGETTAIGDTWKGNLALGKSWTATANCLYDPDDTAQAALRTEFTTGDCDVAAISFYEDGTHYYSGAAVITSFNVTKGINAIDTLTVNFTGNSTLSYT